MQLIMIQSQYLWDPTPQNKCYNKIVICKYAHDKMNETGLGLIPSGKIIVI